MMGESDSASPPSIPNVALKRKPKTAPSAVVTIDPDSIVASVTMALRTAEGGGTKNAGTASARTEASHATVTTANVRSGGRTRLRTRVFAGSMFLERFVQDGGLPSE